MKFVIAPDSFKESVDAYNSAIAIKTGLQKVYKSAEFVILPVADGGEGTMQVLTDALEGEFVELMTSCPLGHSVNAKYGYIASENKAIVEVAEACGLHLVPHQQKNPLNTTSYGVGEIIKNAIAKGAKEIVVGLGGTATNDGGIGLLNSLGAVYNEGNLDARTGADLSQITSVDLTKVFETLKDIKFSIACDVENPWIGENGATYTFGPQKGATPEIANTLEEGMKNWCTIFGTAINNPNISNEPKGGAAGGLGGLLLGLGATMRSGVDLVLETLHFEKHIEGADYVFTGEGSIDSQTANGKTISGITKLCVSKNIPVIALAGRVADDIDTLYDMGLSAVFGIVDSAKSLEQALADGEKSLIKTSENIARILNLQ